MTYTIRIISLFSIISFSLGGCANVEPRDRNHLAKEHMDTIPDPLLASMKDHYYFSREGTTGATGVGSGGCGCN